MPRTIIVKCKHPKIPDPPIFDISSSNDKFGVDSSNSRYSFFSY